MTGKEAVRTHHKKTDIDLVIKEAKKNLKQSV